jgi:RNA polymerase I-specific transcription initiation factor RRN3
MVPTAPGKLQELISQHMPHKLRDRNTQCLYMSAMLDLAERRAGASIREELFAAAVEHLLSIDVEIRWEDIVDVSSGECHFYSFCINLSPKFITIVSWSSSMF